MAAALRHYAGDLTGQTSAALTATDARAALDRTHPGAAASALDAFTAALREAEAAACGACPTPLNDLTQRARAAVDALARGGRAESRRAATTAAAVLVLTMVTAVTAVAQPSAPAPDPGSARVEAERFAHAPPSGPALTNAAIAWERAGEPARARAAALAAVRWEPASSAARAALAAAERTLGLVPSATAGFDQVTVNWWGWGGRRLMMIVGILGLMGAGLWGWLGRTALGRVGWVRALRPWKIVGGLVLAAAGAGLALHTALTVPAADVAVLLDDTSPTRSGPGDGFAPATSDDPSPRIGDLVRIIDSRDGWLRTAAGWWPANAVARVDRAPDLPR